MPSSRPREREGLIPNQILRKPPSRRQGMNLPSIPPLHEQQRGSSREKSPDAGTSTCLSRPASLVLASQTPASPSSRPVVSKPIYHAANPTPSQIYFPLPTTPACFLSLQHVSPHPPAMGRQSFDAPCLFGGSRTDKASLTSPPARPFRLLNRSRVAESAATRCRTERRYRSPAPTPHLSRPRRRRRWATASFPPPPSA